MQEKCPKVSIIMRSFNDILYIRNTLLLLFNQTIKDFELLNTDSGSTDGTFEVIKEYNHDVKKIGPQAYIPGPVLNAMAQKAQGEYLVFLNSDATPQNQFWLEHLIAPFHNANSLAATFGRQVVRPDAHPLVKRDYLSTFAMNAAPVPSPFSSKTVAASNFFSLANAAIRKSYWEMYPFHPKLQYAEDAEWAKWARESGYEIQYVPDAVVVHSHNYTPRQTWKRFYQDARAIGQTATIPDPKKRFFRCAIFPFIAAVIRDVGFCIRHQTLWALFSSPLVRFPQRFGEYFGYRRGYSERTLFQRPK